MERSKIHVSHCPPVSLRVAARSVSTPENDRSRRKDRGADAIEQLILRRGEVPKRRSEHNGEHQRAQQRAKREGQAKSSATNPKNDHTGTPGNPRPHPPTSPPTTFPLP